MATVAAKKVAAKKAVKVAAPVVTAKQKLESFGIDLICDRTAECVPQRTIAAEIGVSWATFIAWINADINRSEQYARARESQADKMAEDILSIADEAVVEAKHQGEDVILDISASAVARNKLRVDARKWLAAKMAPKKYGDKVMNEHTGTDGAPIPHSLTVSFVAPAK